MWPHSFCQPDAANRSAILAALDAGGAPTSATFSCAATSLVSFEDWIRQSCFAPSLFEGAAGTQRLSQIASCRDNKRSAIHDRLAARGAFFKDVSGWEGADWYAGVGQTART